jgi:cell division protein FtsI (penicillin-binding protein 3)
VTQSVYELGSTFKPIAVAAAIDSGTITSMSRRFDATRPLQVGRFKIHDDPGDEQFRWLNIPETLIYSSNIATARIADELGAEKLQDMFRRLGFDKQPVIELGNECAAALARVWGRITVMTTAYGHGIAVTPLHLANAPMPRWLMAASWRPATLRKVDPAHAPQGTRVLKPESTSARMRQLLRLIVLKGTGRKGEAPGFRIAGKTGTAEAAPGVVTTRHRNVSTFAAAFPIDAPRYVMVAMLDSPKANTSIGVYRTTAAWTAAPVVARVMSRTGAMLGVAPDSQSRHRRKRAAAADLGRIPTPTRRIRAMKLGDADGGRRETPTSPGSRSTTARWRREPSSVHSKARVSTARTSSRPR